MNGPETLTRRDRVITLTAVLAALALAGLDQTIVATAGPEIQRDLRIPAALYAWITTAYLVASTVTLPIYGKLSDLYGRKPILLVGVGLFLLGSAISGLAPNTAVLLTGRSVQGLGAASLFTTTLAVMGDLFSPAERGKYMGLIGAIMGLSSVIGPLAGGVITDTLGWHWVFFVNLPIGAAAVWFIVTRMPRFGGRPGAPPVDAAGAAWLVVGVVPLLVALSLGGERAGDAAAPGALPGGLPTLFAISAAGTAAFLWTERRAEEPILDLAFFRDRVIGLATASMFVIGAAFLFSMIFLPLYLVNVVGVSATSAGLTMIPLTLGMVTGSIGGGQLASRVGHVKTLLVGSQILLVGAFAIMGFTLTAASTALEVTWKMILVGLGIGPSLPLYTLVVQNEASQEDLGTATAISTFCRAMGQVIGITVFGAIFAAALHTALAPRITAVLGELPPSTRTVVASASPALEAGGGTGVGFDVVAARTTVRRALAAPTADDPPAPPPPEDASLASALDALDRLDRAFDLALTRAVLVLYRVGMGVVALGVVLTALIPPVTLRGNSTAAAGASVAGDPAPPAPTPPRTPGEA